MKNKYLSHEQRYQIDMLLQRKTQQKTQLILIKTSASTFNKKLGVTPTNTVILPAWRRSENISQLIANSKNDCIFARHLEKCKLVW